MLKDRIDSITAKIAPEMIELRRRIHEHPELAFDPPWCGTGTTSVVDAAAVR